MPEWVECAERIVDLERTLRAIIERFPTAQTPNESQTEDDLIWPVLAALGWTATLRQQNLAPRGREDVPDGLLFATDADKDRANAHPEEWKRYGFGHAVVESKRWLRPLDRAGGRRGEDIAPSTQMLRYLRRVEDLTTGRLRWGILTNGARWRLYWQGARSVSEQFCEINLAAVLNLPGHNDGLFALNDESRRHWLTVFALIFRRVAFVPLGPDPRSFHQRALEQGRFYEERVAASLSSLVFGEVFPDLTTAIATAAPEADLDDVRQAVLILLYRLLFILYAEDRDLLPVSDRRYDDYGLRERVRLDVGARLDRGDTFSETANRYWNAVQDLCRAINKGDASIGLPPYNGGLFDEDRTPLLADIRIGDAVMARVIDALSFERTTDGRKYINYRDLSVQQLGSIYERLLEHEVTREEEAILIRPNIFARRGSGSYYTPDDLVALILKETVAPLVATKLDGFRDRIESLPGESVPEDRRIAILKGLDPAEAILSFKVCDPAMGSGHFLVSLVDTLADQVIAAMAEAEAAIPAQWGDYVSPLAARIEAIRITIERNAADRGWTVDPGQLDDRHIIRRMVLKRCVYGVDKNPMAVELAKVALWLHTFTVGAPLSFLDHHLRCGDSLFGSWVRNGIDKATAWGGPLLLHGPITRALRAASKMQIIEGLTDAEIAEAHRSADVFAEVQEMTAPLAAFLALIHAFDWLKVTDRPGKAAVRAFFDGQFGDPVLIAQGHADPSVRREDGVLFAAILGKARTLIAEENFMSWQVAFPGVWSDWDGDHLTGGFDAIIGNPPWDRLKLQQVEWFAARRPAIARAPHAADRKRMIEALRADSDPLVTAFEKADTRAAAASRMARQGGDYPLLSGGDTNINSLFVERASHIVAPHGMVGLLIPSGIATEPTSQQFFTRIIESKRASCCFDFFNRRSTRQLFFPDVYYRFKFCILVFSGGAPAFETCRFSSFVRDIADLADGNNVYTMGVDHFRKVNPNTRTAPVYRSSIDREIVTGIYDRLPVLVDRSSGAEIKTWPVKYVRMFDMANDSGLFRTPPELERNEGAWPEEGGRWRSSAGTWLPLYEGKMVQAYDHRASGIAIVEANLYRTGQAATTSDDQRQDPAYLPASRYFILNPGNLDYEVAIKDITSTTNARSLIACLIPPVGAGHTLPVLRIEAEDPSTRLDYKTALVATLNSTVVDFVARTKVLSNHASWYILEQLPVVPIERFEQALFGAKTARDIIRESVLELTYTAHDMRPFARGMEYCDDAGDMKPPFVWDEERRIRLRSRLDALFFILYGITDRDVVNHIYSTFPIVEEQETALWGVHRSRDLCLAWMNALVAGNPDAEIAL
ncbi:putative type II DNA modification enzyme [alpha proteobacterium BAL199]|nr:putative type II DNA modification enzyme [alpha proteobacterium BAL199]